MKIRVVTEEEDVPVNIKVANTKTTNVQILKLRQNALIKAQKEAEKQTYTRVINSLGNLKLTTINVTIQGKR